MYNNVFISIPITDEKGLIATYQVLGLGAAGLEHLCILKEDIMAGTIFRYTKSGIETPTAKYSDIRSAIYTLKDEFLAPIFKDGKREIKKNEPNTD